MTCPSQSNTHVTCHEIVRITFTDDPRVKVEPDADGWAVSVAGDHLMRWTAQADTEVPYPVAIAIDLINARLDANTAEVKAIRDRLQRKIGRLISRQVSAQGTTGPVEGLKVPTEPAAESGSPSADDVQGALCIEHGVITRVDEDGCCLSCGRDSMWYGAHQQDLRQQARECFAELERDLEAAEAERNRLRELIDNPHTGNWLEAVKLEAAHQRERWGSEHDAGKGPLDWFWLLGHLATKAALAAIAGDRDKALHHTISSGAVLLNWHANLTGASTVMRPGIADPETTT